MLSAWQKERCSKCADRVIAYIEEAIQALAGAREALRLAKALDGLNPPYSVCSDLDDALALLQGLYFRSWIRLNRWPVDLAEAQSEEVEEGR